ncbi:MAG: DNA-directed RNA polymerase [Candidatus Thermoplasmatota archaeon]|jgi:DNA-directed RNA polymerase subunit E'|nr:DNA-directed RNA polymerase [Candidatus Thermoplasmatota archaeon]
MYITVEKEYIARIPPEKLSGDYDEAVKQVAKESIEGKLIDLTEENYQNKKAFIISVVSVKTVGEGTIVHGDGGVYQSIQYKALGYLPEMQEVVDGIVTSVKEFGAFVRFGPFEGLLHISQIMDDMISTDLTNQRIIGKETKREIKVGDKVRVKIVSLNLASASMLDSRIGLNMKQLGLGKLDWLYQVKKEKVK